MKLPIKLIVLINIANLSFTASGTCGDIIWYPLWANPYVEFNDITEIGQEGSEVIIIAGGPDTFASPDNLVPSQVVAVDVPSIFVTYCIFSLEISAFNIDFDRKLWGIDIHNYEKYNYDLGDGWIYHQKSGDLSKGLRFAKSFGWLYIQDYPWVYGLDFGWRYVIEAGIAWNSNAWWFHEPGFGWFWTTRDMYPNIYHADSGWTVYTAP